MTCSVVEDATRAAALVLGGGGASDVSVGVGAALEGVGTGASVVTGFVAGACPPASSVPLPPPEAPGASGSTRAAAPSSAVLPSAVAIQVPVAAEKTPSSTLSVTITTRPRSPMGDTARERITERLQREPYERTGHISRVRHSTTDMDSAAIGRFGVTPFSRFGLRRSHLRTLSPGGQSGPGR